MFGNNLQTKSGELKKPIRVVSPPICRGNRSMLLLLFLGLHSLGGILFSRSYFLYLSTCPSFFGLWPMALFESKVLQSKPASFNYLLMASTVVFLSGVLFFSYLTLASSTPLQCDNLEQQLITIPILDGHQNSFQWFKNSTAQFGVFFQSFNLLSSAHNVRLKSSLRSLAFPIERCTHCRLFSTIPFFIFPNHSFADCPGFKDSSLHYILIFKNK